MDPVNLIKSKDKKTQNKKGFQFRLKINLWTVVIGFLLLFFVIPAVTTAIGSLGSSSKETISQLITDIKAGKVDKISVNSTKLLVT